MTRRPVDQKSFERALRALGRERGARARAAARRLEALVAARIRAPGTGRMKLISIHLEEWQIEAAKLVAARDGGSYQELIRRWVVAGIRAGARPRGRRGR